MIDRMGQTIVAESSAPGCGAVGVVRLSGGQALAVAAAMTAVPAELPIVAGSTHLWGELVLDDDLRLPAHLYVFRAPRSYTREDVVELHVPGSPALLAMIRRRAMALGAIAALPGEFTARAFLNGAMDLSKAEAVAGVIRAESDTQLRAARRMMDGHFAGAIAGARDELGELLALVEADIDFAEEPIEFITPPELHARLRSVSARIEALSAGAASIERLGGLPRILLLGPPNAGKSSLMNALSGTSRAICAAVAGTTRDILSAPIRLGRGEAILLDAAGVDESQDEIIARARELTLVEAEHVDALCVVIDVTSPPDARFIEQVRSLDAPNRVVAVNKCDLVGWAVPTRNAGCSSPSNPQSAARDPQFADLGPVCLVSARDGRGLDELREVLAASLSGIGGTVAGESPIITERHRSAVADAVAAIGRAAVLSKGAIETIDCADVLAFELREAVEALGSVTGDVTTEDLLTQIFANFCIGK